MAARFDTVDLVWQKRQAAHLDAARTYEQNSDFYRSVGEMFAALGFDAEVRHAYLAADRANRMAERERSYLARPVESDCR